MYTFIESLCGNLQSENSLDDVQYNGQLDSAHKKKFWMFYKLNILVLQPF